MREFDRGRELRRYFSWLAIGTSLLLCLRVNQVRAGALLDREGIKSAAQIMRGLLHPNLSPDFLQRVAQLSVESLLVGLLGTVLAVTLGTVLALLAIKVPELPDSPTHRRTLLATLEVFIRWLARFVLGFFRSIPEIVWAYAFVRMLGLGPGAAVSAIGLTAGGSVGKLFSELAESVDPRIIGGLRAAGLNRWGIILHGIMPQVKKQWVAYALFSLECNVRTGTVLGVVGAGGLGSEIALSIRYFEFDKLATTLLAVLVFVIALEMLSTALRRCSAKWSLAFAAVAGIASFHYLDIPWSDIFTGNLGGPRAPATFGLSFSYLSHVTALMFRTVLMAWAATILAAVVAFFAAPLSTNRLIANSYLRGSYERNGWSRFVRGAVFLTTKLVLQIARSIPELVLALLLVFWVGPGALAGILAIAIHNIGVLSRLYTDVYQEVEPGPPRSLETAGAGLLSVWFFGVLPQVVSRLVAVTLYRFEVNLRATITVGFVGAGGAGDALNNAIALFHIGDLTVLLVVMLVFVTGIDYLGDRVRHRILLGRAGRRAKKEVATVATAPHELEVSSIPEITGANVFCRIGTKQEYKQAHIVELSPTSMIIACKGGCPGGLVVHWLVRRLDNGQPLEGLARVVPVGLDGSAAGIDKLRLEFVHPTEHQLMGLRQIATIYGVHFEDQDGLLVEPVKSQTASIGAV